MTCSAVSASACLSRLIALLAALVLCLAVALPVAAQQRLERLAAAGPWPVASNMIAYKGRLWFSVSVKGRNHNSADLWSLDAGTGDLRYERHLFSQDAAPPIVFQGLLYWPHEDPRISLGYASFSVTDGNAWRELDITTAQAFHLHHLINWGGTLVAATSAWRAGLQTSDDGGASWSQFYDHPTPQRRVSRLLTPAVALGRLFFKLRDASGIQLVRVTEYDPAIIADWPQVEFAALTAVGSSLYAIARRAIWRTNGRRSERVVLPSMGGNPVDLFAGKDRLWAMFANPDGGGYVASRANDGDWHIEANFDNGTPHEVIAAPNQILVAGTDSNGMAAIWGIPATALKPATGGYQRAFPAPLKLPPSDAIDWQRQSELLKDALKAPANFRNHGRGGLRDIVQKIVALSPPPGFLANHLNAPMPDIEVAVIGGETMVPARHMGQWILLWGMAADSRSRVPLEFISRTWPHAPRSSEKYFDPLLAALHTISRNGQNDPETIAALIARLKAPDDPMWLKGDIAGALNAVTGAGLGYDPADWTRWLSQQGSN